MVHQEGDGGGGGTRTNFTAHSHQQLLKMHEGTNPAVVSRLSQTYLQAAQILGEAADTLRLDLERVEWEGSAADSIRDWGNQFVIATTKMMIYTSDVGTISGNLGLDMGNVQIPPLPANSIAVVNQAKANPAAGIVDPTQAVAVNTAESHIKQEQLEAASQMTRLASAYDVAASRLAAMTPPTLPPPPNVYSLPIDDFRAINGPGSGSGPGGSITRGGGSGTDKPGSGGKSGSPGSVSAPPPPGNGSAGSAPGWIPGSPPAGSGYTPPADLGLAGVETLTRPDGGQPGISPPVSPTGSGGPGQPPHGPGPTGPPITGTPPLTTNSGGRTGKVPGISGGTSTVPNKFTGTPPSGPSGGGTTGRPMSNGPTSGTSGGRQAPGGGSTGPGPYGRSGPGIVGGQQTPSPTGPQNGTSRGGFRTGVEGGLPPRGAIGAHGETGPGQGGRSPMGVGGGGTSTGGGSSRVGGTSGNSMLRTPGGMVGGQPQSGASSRAFSPGGTGLRTGAPEGPRPAGGPGGTAGSSSRGGRMGGGIGGPAVSDEERRRRRERADYLEEDESTWTTRGSSVPPVVD